MANFIRDTALGSIIRLVTRNRVLQFPEDCLDFQCSVAYLYTPESYPPKQHEPAVADPASSAPETVDKVERVPSKAMDEVEKHPALDEPDTDSDTESSISDMALPSRVETRLDMAKVKSSNDLEKALTNATLARGPTRPIVPTRTTDGITLVDWYTTDDPENPQNWSAAKKGFVAFQIVSASLHALDIYGQIAHVLSLVSLYFWCLHGKCHIYRE